MYNLYQSQVWKDIQTQVYHKPTFTINLFGKEHFGIIKRKKIWPFQIQRFQIMWVELPNDKQLVIKEINRIREEYKAFGNISFQLGLSNEIISFENVSHRSDTFKQDMKQMRLNIRDYICHTYWLNLAFRENMPQSDIIYDITKTDEELYAEMNSWCKERIKKATKKWVQFSIASPDQYKLFYDKRYETAGGKWFNIIPYSQYEDLIRYMTQNSRGNLFTSHIDWELVAWSICIYDQHRIIYLYWFSNRKFWNIWWHHYLKYKIFWRARDNGFSYCDMMWWAPTGFDNHPLSSVSAFKESLWWMKIEQYWSYDIVLNPFLYKIFKKYYEFKHPEN